MHYRVAESGGDMSDTEARGHREKPWSGGGREELSAAVRRLTAAVVTASAGPDVLHDAAARVGAIADELAAHVPALGPVPTARYAESRRRQPGSMASEMPFDMIIGTCNPVAPPITIVFEQSRVVGTATFSPQHEGAPGCVHGAALAGAFDIILTAANHLEDAAGPTVELRIHYRKPTVMAQPARFEAWVTGRRGRRVESQGRLVQNGVVTVEATGVFIVMERARIASLHRRDNVVGAPTTPPAGDRSGDHTV
ncbi:MAG TPA: PaaI family thioesterase [Acidimicrobiales bacterium]|nr:PaaI family thioesterase [Acidimicrobiales bacterium]